MLGSKIYFHRLSMYLTLNYFYRNNSTVKIMSTSEFILVINKNLALE